MQDNFGKCNFILSTDELAEMQVGESLIKSTNYEKLLGIKINSKFTFGKHIKAVHKKASNKLRAPARVTADVIVEKKKDSNEFFLQLFI